MAKLCRHLYIAKAYEIVVHQHRVYIVMEYAHSGSLEERLYGQQQLGEDDAKRYFCQLIAALDYLHNTVRAIHRDIKTENVLLTECGIKLIDFGSSSHMGSCFFSYIQSRYYRAPEVILGLPYSSSIDMWSVACVLVSRCAFSLNASTKFAQASLCSEEETNSNRSFSFLLCWEILPQTCSLFDLDALLIYVAREKGGGLLPANACPG